MSRSALKSKWNQSETVQDSSSEKRKKASSHRHSPSKALKKASPIKKRDQLLLAGKKLFARQGLSGTSIRDIAQQAGMNSSMISY